MSAVRSTEGAAERELRIGEVASLTGVTTRTLRYYEELGMINSVPRPTGGQERRYAASEVARVRRIRELQEVLGSGLSQIREVLAAEDRLEGLRQAYRESTSREEQAQVLREAVAVADRQLEQVTGRQRKLSALRREIEARRQRQLQALADLEPAIHS